MNYSHDERVDNREKSKKYLYEIKEKERTITFYSKKINKNTIVYCKNKERIEEYEKSYNDIKNW
jgi:hypothetical protein